MEWFSRLIMLPGLTEAAQNIRGDMSIKCESIDSCGFAKNYSENSEVVKNGWIKLFCENHEMAENCKRKAIRKETGEPPVAAMSPTGQMLL